LASSQTDDDRLTADVTPCRRVHYGEAPYGEAI